MTYSVLIATYNRAAFLRDTLESLARVRCDEPWEVIVANNNSSDDTDAVVESAARTFPVPLRSVFVGEQGKAAALNAAMKLATGTIFVFTDDDARFPENWLTCAGEGLDRLQCDYVGGKVLPLWSAPRPAWFPEQRDLMWAVLAILDYGESPGEFGVDIVGWPLGVNMAVRAAAFRSTGDWDPQLDRRGRSLLGQGQREWCLRAQAAGLHGFYYPQLSVQHLVEPGRLTKRYFRRWFYWLGVSRAVLYHRFNADLEQPEQPARDRATTPHIAGVPRYMYRRVIKKTAAMIAAVLKGDRVQAAANEMWLCFFVGVLRQRLRDTTFARRVVDKKRSAAPNPSHG